MHAYKLENEFLYTFLVIMPNIFRRHSRIFLKRKDCLFSLVNRVIQAFTSYISPFSDVQWSNGWIRKDFVGLFSNNEGIATFSLPYLLSSLLPHTTRYSPATINIAPITLHNYINNI